MTRGNALGGDPAPAGASHVNTRLDGGLRASNAIELPGKPVNASWNSSTPASRYPAPDLRTGAVLGQFVDNRQVLQAMSTRSGPIRSMRRRARSKTRRGGHVGQVVVAAASSGQALT